MWSSWRGHLDIVKHLLHFKPNVNATAKVMVLVLTYMIGLLSLYNSRKGGLPLFSPAEKATVR